MVVVVFFSDRLLFEIILMVLGVLKLPLCKVMQRWDVVSDLISSMKKSNFSDSVVLFNAIKRYNNTG